jgi:mannose-6-phosphate isomerase-like protein (cupin superfamily)
MNTMEVDRMIRSWGEWEVLHSLGTTKVKKLIVNPRSELSYQRHFYRNELWYVHQGEGILLFNYEEDPTKAPNEENLLFVGRIITIHKKMWHQVINTGKESLIIIEIQYGDKCIEDDIERKNL